MYEFHRKHDKPIFDEDISIRYFRSLIFWKDVIRQIPPLIRKLAEYYQIPQEKYPEIIILFDDERWEEWRTLYGKKHKLGQITGGTYSPLQNRISFNPYLYLFQGGNEFISTLYHELVHWIIEHVNYLNEEWVDKSGETHYHILDFDMVYCDIFDVKDKDKNKDWSTYRSLKTGVGAYHNIQKLRYIYAEPVNKDSEYYTGQYCYADREGYYEFSVDYRLTT